MHFFSFFRVILLILRLKRGLGFFGVCLTVGITNCDYSRFISAKIFLRNLESLFREKPFCRSTTRRSS